MSSQNPPPIVIYEDEALLVVDKPVGMVVHEGAGEQTNLLTDWITSQRPEIVEAFKDEPEQEFYRPGIVHRLDKDTSGLLIVAKNPTIREKLQRQFKERTVLKEYLVLVLGQPRPESGRIESYISRNPRRRREMSVSHQEKGKPAITEYSTQAVYNYHDKGGNQSVSLLKVRLHTGRMHQIRVHLKSRGWPVIGDQTYQTKPSRNLSRQLGLNRQFLHAATLTIDHPADGRRLTFTAELPAELATVIKRISGEVQ